ncbi:hypothetical protein EMIT0111MI5_60047 [Burkholderia sp. IT-111MI5]
MGQFELRRRAAAYRHGRRDAAEHQVLALFRQPVVDVHQDAAVRADGQSCHDGLEATMAHDGDDAAGRDGLRQARSHRVNPLRQHVVTDGLPGLLDGDPTGVSFAALAHQFMHRMQHGWFMHMRIGMMVHG